MILLFEFLKGFIRDSIQQINNNMKQTYRNGGRRRKVVDSLDRRGVTARGSDSSTLHHFWTKGVHGGMN